MVRGIDSSLVQAEAWMESALAACMLVLGLVTANTQLLKGDDDTGLDPTWCHPVRREVIPSGSVRPGGSAGV